MAVRCPMPVCAREVGNVTCSQRRRPPAQGHQQPGTASRTARPPEAGLPPAAPERFPTMLMRKLTVRSCHHTKIAGSAGGLGNRGGPRSHSWSWLIGCRQDDVPSIPTTGRHGQTGVHEAAAPELRLGWVVVPKSTRGRPGSRARIRVKNRPTNNGSSGQHDGRVAKVRQGCACLGRRSPWSA